MNKSICTLLSAIAMLTPFSADLFAGGPYPLGFSIPERTLVKEIPEKDRDFAFPMPWDMSTWIFTVESEYYKAYQRSYFGITMKKGGWDCMRHYEILANGCIPYFVDIDQCDPNTLAFFPKELIKEAMSLEGISYETRKIDHEKFDKKRYYEILNQLLEYTREHLTTKKMAEQLLKTLNYTGTGKILYISWNTDPDYFRCLTLEGLKELMGDRIIDYPKVPHLYNTCELKPDIYGRGFTYTKNLEDLPIDRENIENRIKDMEFDLIIYGSVHRGQPFIDVVQETYPSEKIAYLCGEDKHSCQYSDWNNLFIREFNCLRNR